MGLTGLMQQHKELFMLHKELKGVKVKILPVFAFHLTDLMLHV